MPYHYGAIKGIEIYKTDVVIKREGDAPETQNAERGEIHEFSKTSRQRLAFVASNTEVVFTAMITLTYPMEYPNDGERVKRDLRAFLDWLRRETGGCEYLWFLEFQKRGAPHFHILYDGLWPRTRDGERSLRWRVASTWYRLADTGDRKHLAAGTRTEKLRSAEGGARYAVKYAMKMKQKIVPSEYTNVGRFWGHSKGVKPAPAECHQCTEDDIRGVLEGWDYEPHEKQHLWKVLFNTSGRFHLWIDEGFDKGQVPWYAGAQHQQVTAPDKGNIQGGICE